MKNWRKWALNGILCMMAVMTLADLAGFGRKGGGLDTQAEDSAGITPLKGSTGLIETVGEILAAGGQTAEEEKILGGASLTLLANVEGKQSLSAVIQTKEGSLIVVDGGTVADADHLTDVLASKGGHVKAWLITHPHDDHIGALNTILAREEKTACQKGPVPASLKMAARVSQGPTKKIGRFTHSDIPCHRQSQNRSVVAFLIRLPFNPSAFFLPIVRLLRQIYGM